jgi:hypothetical protein
MEADSRVHGQWRLYGYNDFTESDFSDQNIMYYIFDYSKYYRSHLLSKCATGNMADGCKFKKNLVVLVHGTWARGIIPFLKKDIAAWCDNGSNIRRSCIKVLGNNIEFHPFQWSGGNSPSGRKESLTNQL